VVETRSGEAGGRVWTAPRLGIVDAVTDERGEFRLEGLPKGSYSVTASASGYGRTTKLNASSEEPVELYLFPGSGIYGRLLDDKGIPVEGAIVFVESHERISRMFGPLPIEQSDVDGRFAILGLDPGRYRLFASKEGSAPAVHDLELTKERDTEVELVLTVGVTLRGRLVDVDDEPVEGRVFLSALDGGEVGVFLRSSFTAETDAEGVFSLVSVPAGDHTLVAEARGYGATNVDASVSGRNKQEDLGDVVLETGLAISGRVVSASGSPIAGANLYAFPSFRPGMAAVRDRTFEADTDEEGRFILAGLSEGSYNVHVEAAGFAHSNPAVAATGQTNVTITLKPAGSIRGTAVDPEGRPVASLHAEARSPDERGFSLVGGAGEGGVFVVETVPEGEYAVQITAPDFLPGVVSSVRVTAGSVTELGTVRLRRGGRIEGTVVNASDEAVPGATVRALSLERSPYIYGGDEAVATDRLGRFRVGGLADGVVQVVASHPGYAETRLEKVSIDSSSGASEVRIVLRRGGAVEGYVRGREAADVAGRRIQASFEGGARRPWDAPSAETSEDGYFRIEHLPPGKVTVALVQVEPASMYAIQTREIEVREDETTYVELHSRRILVQGQVRRGGAGCSSFGSRHRFRPRDFLWGDERELRASRTPFLAHGSSIPCGRRLR
ncbi:MAG TPA: carboxypeptidase-like regulatory domain-containing protein, partial [Vicinamibacteria bacterium]